MRFVKLAVVSLLLLFLLATAIASLLPSSINISRAVDINASSDNVYEKLRSFNKWESWLANRDTVALQVQNDKLVFGNTTVYAVSANRNKVVTDWQVKSGSKMRGTFNIITHPGTSVTTVQWIFVLKVKWYPWEKFSSIVSDRVVGPFMEESLDNLKKTLQEGK